MCDLKEFLVAVGIIVVFVLTIPWISRLIDVWVDYKNWVLGL